MSTVDPVAQLLAIEALKKLKAKYWRTVDLKRFDDWRSVFTDDAQFDLPGMKPQTVEEFVQAAAAFLDGALTVHHGHNPEIEITGENSAEGTWAFQDYVEWPPQDGERRAYRGCGRYTERYRRDSDGEWRIAFMKIRFYRADTLAGPPPTTFALLADGIEPVPSAYTPS